MHRYNIGITWHFTPDEGGYQFPVPIQMSCTGTISELHSIFTPDEEGGEVSISGAYPDVMQRNKVRIVCIFMLDERGVGRYQSS